MAAQKKARTLTKRGTKRAVVSTEEDVNTSTKRRSVRVKKRPTSNGDGYVGTNNSWIVESPSPMSTTTPNPASPQTDQGVNSEHTLLRATPSKLLGEFHPRGRRPTRTFSKGRLKAQFQDVVRVVLRDNKVCMTPRTMNIELTDVSFR